MSSSVLILLVEDEHLIRDMMQISLEDGGFSVVTAGCGAEAITLFDAKHADLAALITDVRLGAGPSGWEIARHVRHARPELPVVYMTGDSAADWTAEGVPKSVLLQKPFAPAQAITAVSTLLNEVSSAPPVG